MFMKIVNCPHCDGETKMTFDITEDGSFEGYENHCNYCKKPFIYLVMGKVGKD